ncbi:MAG: GreA/GreB family elongation factor [Planctomycetes bacterium]|nr:GreA/GreB family elongation factor [Planctomycetota bacterium]
MTAALDSEDRNDDTAGLFAYWNLTAGVVHQVIQPESLVQLIAAGNARTVEEEWMRIIESPDLSPGDLTAYGVVLAALSKRERAAEAGALAWAAIELLSPRCPAMDTLGLAGVFLLAVGESEDLRGQVTELFRSAYPDQEGLEGLLKEAGIAGGRPVRRALRTLDVCLKLDVGHFLVSRDEDQAARVDGIDRDSWTFTISTGDGSVQRGAVLLADEYQPASPTELRVLRCFAPDELAQRLTNDPASIVIELCKRHDNKLTRDELEARLVPELLGQAEWKKWWPRARTGLKRYPTVRIDRRAPYAITLLDEALTPEELHLLGFSKLPDPLKQAEAVEAYLRDCKARGTAFSEDALEDCCGDLCGKAKRTPAVNTPRAAQFWVIACWIRKMAGQHGLIDGALELFRNTDDLGALFSRLEQDTLHEVACDILMAARPAAWPDKLLDLLATFPMAACERAAKLLIDAGRTIDDFEPIIAKILSSPAQHFDALTWLWNGPAAARHIPERPAVTLLFRILRALHDSRLGDKLPRETVKRIAQRARAVLSARQYERYKACLDRIELGMASALRTQIVRSESLGRVVREDLLKILRTKFPTLEVKVVVPPWEREDVMFVTQTGMQRKHREIEHHVNVTMKDNARAIGAAAERGDLSENSEYKFALEERDLLRARLAQMNSEMAIAEVMDEDRVPTDHVGVGTRVVFERVGDRDRYEMTVVGPWEAGQSESWFNYKAPLAQKIMGARIGDLVDFDHAGVTGQYQIVALANGLIEAIPAQGDEE